MFKIYLSDTATYLFTVADSAELEKKLRELNMNNSSIVIRNDKNEPCDINLQVIPSSFTSMESMGGLLQTKFGKK
jgi:hypothetical protein